MADINPAWPTSDADEAYWRDTAAGFMDAPDQAYLNTGSWGVLHRSVFDALVRGLQELEANPTWNRNQLVERMNQARRDLGAFLNARPEDIAFNTNVTVSMNQVIHGLDWRPGDEILASDQEYGAIDNSLHYAERRYGVVVKRAAIALPPDGPEEIVESFRRSITDRTRMLFISHVTSPSGLVTPIRALAELAHGHGALIAVDGAHAPGQIPLDLADYGCDFYGGNCHKWLCAPKGTGFLHVRPEVQDKLHHIAVSHGYDRERGSVCNDAGALEIHGQPFMWQLTTIGTRELSSFGAVSEAVALQNEIGKERIAVRGRQLAGYLRERMAATGWVEPLSSPHPELANSISTFRLKGFAENPGPILYDKYRITTPTWGEADPGYTQRVSTHIYNDFAEMDRLVDALGEIREG